MGLGKRERKTWGGLEATAAVASSSAAIDINQKGNSCHSPMPRVRVLLHQEGGGLSLKAYFFSNSTLFQQWSLVRQSRLIPCSLTLHLVSLKAACEFISRLDQNPLSYFTFFIVNEATEIAFESDPIFLRSKK